MRAKKKCYQASLYLTACILFIACFDLNRAELPEGETVGRTLGQLAWVGHITGPGTTSAHSIDVFRSGDWAISGFFVESVDLDIFGNTSQAMVTTGLQNGYSVFATRFTENQIFDWVSIAEGWIRESSICAMEDKTSVLVGNYFELRTDVQGESFYQRVERNGVFVLGYDVQGTSPWAVTIDQTSELVQPSITAIPGYAQGFLICGAYLSPAKITNHTADRTYELSQTNGACPDEFPGLFFARFDKHGELDWSMTPAGCAVGTDIHALDGQNFLVAGSFVDTIAFSDDTILKEFADEKGDSFLALYRMTAQSAAPLWARSIGGMGKNEVSALTYKAGYGVFVAGLFRGNVAMQYSESKETEVYGNGSEKEQLFIANYSPVGTLDWVRTVPCSGSMNIAQIAAFEDGSLLIAGDFSGDMNWGSRDTYEKILTAEGGRDGFLAHFDPKGVFGWVQKVGGPYGEDSVSDIAVLGNSVAYILGSFQGEVVFAEGDKEESSFDAKGDLDSFLMKYTWNDGGGS